MQCLAHDPPLPPARVAQLLVGEAIAACNELPEPLPEDDWEARQELGEGADSGGFEEEGGMGSGRCGVQPAALLQSLNQRLQQATPPELG